MNMQEYNIYIKSSSFQNTDLDSISWENVNPADEKIRILPREIKVDSDPWYQTIIISGSVSYMFLTKKIGPRSTHTHLHFNSYFICHLMKDVLQKAEDRREPTKGFMTFPQRQKKYVWTLIKVILHFTAENRFTLSQKALMAPRGS